MEVVGERDLFWFNIRKKKITQILPLLQKIRNSKNEANTLKCYWVSFKNAR